MIWVVAFLLVSALIEISNLEWKVRRQALLLDDATQAIRRAQYQQIYASAQQWRAIAAIQDRLGIEQPMDEMKGFVTFEEWMKYQGERL